MKKFYLFLISAFICSLSFATPINANVNNGNWKNATTWDKSRKPKDGDTVVIPAGKTVIVNSWETLKNVYIKVYGKLQFSGWFTALNLDSYSTIVVYNNASIEVNYFQYIFIGGSYVFYEGQLAGPVIVTSSGVSGFNPLPVKFVGFTVTSQNNNALIQWSTSEEMDANIYEVERSEDGSNWSTIAYVAAVGNSSAVNNYSYTDKNISAKVVYYRVKEVDIDGKTSFTVIKSIKTNLTYTTADIKIASIQNKVLLQFPQEIKGRLLVRFVSLNGQIVDQQNINNPVGQVVLNSKVTGVYIISVSNGQGINTAKQVIL